jgi:hypothetical protein
LRESLGERGVQGAEVAVAAGRLGVYERGPVAELRAREIKLIFEEGEVCNRLRR